MKPIRHVSGPLHSDVARQVAVGAAHPGGVRALQISVEMGHLHQSVHASIGPASAQQLWGVAGHEPGQGDLQVILDGPTAGLTLPAVVVGAAVGDAERNPQNISSGVRSTQLGQECPGLVFESARGLLDHFFSERPCTFRVTDGHEFSSQ